MNRQALSQSSNPLLHNLRDLTQIQSSKTSPLACRGSQTLGFCAGTSVCSDWSAQLQVAQGFEYHPWLHGLDTVLVHLFKGITHLSPLKTHIREITSLLKTHWLLPVYHGFQTFSDPYHFTEAALTSCVPWHTEHTPTQEPSFALNCSSAWITPPLRTQGN